MGASAGFTEQQELVGVAEVASRLGLTAERVRQLAKNNRLPEPVGRLGRQLVWIWRDIAAWAEQEGRLSGDRDTSRQVQVAWHQQPRGILRLVVDELMAWGDRERNVCHVRIWAGNADESQVVLLGQLQDNVASVTNGIETVAMTVAKRYLGPRWTSAQFYEYSPDAGFGDDYEFRHITFTIKKWTAADRLRSLGRDAGRLARDLGAELVDPAWRRVKAEELEHLTGDAPQLWTAGTYTRALVHYARAHAGGANIELVWDPERAHDLSEIAKDLATGSPQLMDLPIALDESARVALYTLLAHTVRDAQATAQQDVHTQPADAAILLRPPTLRDARTLFAACEHQSLDTVDPHKLWDALVALRATLITHNYPNDPALDRERQLLVPGVRGGWVPLHWDDAGVDEVVPARSGWSGPIALPDDVVTDDDASTHRELADRFVLLTETISAHLRESWQDWHWHDVPCFTPSVPMAATGPLTRQFLGEITWLTDDDIDPDRLRRLRGLHHLDRVGVDVDGWLVAVSEDQQWFQSEWPVSGVRDDQLRHAAIRADRPSERGSTPVYIQGPDGALRPLPSAPIRNHGNAYAWGYGGTGPSDLAAATVDVLRRASGEQVTFDDEAADGLAHEYASGPRTPNWPVDELLVKLAERRPRARRPRKTRPT
jgi:predicted DNA-binding transcriptional regulator AlpA